MTKSEVGGGFVFGKNNVTEKGFVRMRQSERDL